MAALTLSFGSSNYFENINTDRGELRRLLDGRSNKEKLEGMKRLVALMSIGKDVSDLFPDVVKLVVCNSLEVKKLVYLFLTHHAEHKPEIALLSINTFQKELKDRNQLVRAGALRVMSSIRVHIIVQLVILALKKCCLDSSPYVRKTAMNAVSKVFALDQTQKDILAEVIGKSFRDNSTMVISSAVAAFNEVCPERLEMIHPIYRKLCKMLPDVDEWGQISIINLLLRYGRSQFKTPFRDDDAPRKIEKKASSGTGGQKKAKKAFYSDDEAEDGKVDGDRGGEEDSEDDFFSEKKKGRKQSRADGRRGDRSDSEDEGEEQMDPDHRLLLQAAAPLMQSRNSGVVMAVASLYFHLAPVLEAQKVARSMVRAMRSGREMGYVVLNNIATMSVERPKMFTPYLKDFFIKSDEPSFNRNLKLDILTQIADEAGIHTILKEFQQYIKHPDRTFVASTIQAIGRCAIAVSEVKDQCTKVLVGLVSHRSEVVSAESIVVLRKLLPGHPRQEKIVTFLARKLPATEKAEARASIVWMVGEYHHLIPTICPDVLRELAQGFSSEDAEVKIQILNLGAKLVSADLGEPSPRIRQIFNYLLDLAKYDTANDIRDKGRMLRCVMDETVVASNPVIAAVRGNLSQVFLPCKPPIHAESPHAGRQRFQLGSLSHVVGHACFNYHPLPDFPEVPPDGKPRDGVDMFADEKKKRGDRGFFSDDDSGSGSYSGSESGSGSYTGSSYSSGSRRGRGRSSRRRSYSGSSSGYSYSRSGSSDRSYSRSRSGSRSYSSGSRSRSPSRSPSRSRSRSPSPGFEELKSPMQPAPEARKESVLIAVETPKTEQAPQLTRLEENVGPAQTDSLLDLSTPAAATPSAADPLAELENAFDSVMGGVTNPPLNQGNSQGNLMD